MKILYVLSNDIAYNSSANIRNISLIRGLLDLGHEVQIICLYHGKKRDKSLLASITDADILCLNSINETEDVVQSGSKSKNKAYLWLRKYAVKIFEHIRIYDQYKIKAQHVNIDKAKIIAPDLVISSSDPRSSHLLAKRVLDIIGYKGCYVQYWGDPMSLDIASPVFLRPFLKRAEMKLLKIPDLIVYTNKLICQYITECYGIEKKKVAAIPTSHYLICKTESNQSENSLSNDSSDLITIGYLGGFYKQSRNMKPLFDAVLENPKLKLVLVGSTDWDIPVSDRIISYKHMTASETAVIQDSLDILIVMENMPHKGTDICYQIPGKAYHYGLTNKRVLIVKETGICEDEFKELGRYYFSANVKDDINNSIMALTKERDPKYSSPLRSFYPNVVAARLLELVENVSKIN